ncbi:hypothetical protein GCM10009116_14850 [Brevundimonas basaltis]|uniref:Uncharacterized protein n=1 Tax=Brevundimonas basaltis TaxID=472166 RepID=A0A7W8HWI4_9CAUL|nr:hypothetical protein [Brevundimonas basaltis]MBB5291202.1 hypothetical protein [Brevundimonas basaltis]
MTMRAIGFAAALCLVGLPDRTATASPPAAVEPSWPTGEAAVDTPELENLSVPGRVRARGIYGLFSVAGVLSFQGGRLHWTVDGVTESGRYDQSQTADGARFSADYVTRDNERLQWSGYVRNGRLRDVTAIWTRARGDFVHDLLLPRRLTLDFTPDRQRSSR